MASFQEGPASLVSRNATAAVSQYRFVTADATGVSHSGAGAAATGISDNEAAADGVVTYALPGSIRIMEAGAPVLEGAEVTPDADGKAVTATTGDVSCGRALSAAAADTDLISVAFEIGNVLP